MQYLSSVVVSVKIVPNLGGRRGGQVIIPEVNDTGQFFNENLFDSCALPGKEISQIEKFL